MEIVNDLTMRYFIDNIKTYANVNKKGRALQIYVQQFDRHLIADECSLIHNSPQMTKGLSLITLP